MIKNRFLLRAITSGQLSAWGQRCLASNICDRKSPQPACCSLFRSKEDAIKFSMGIGGVLWRFPPLRTFFVFENECFIPESLWRKWETKHYSLEYFSLSWLITWAMALSTFAENIFIVTEVLLRNLYRNHMSSTHGLMMKSINNYNKNTIFSGLWPATFFS